MTRGSFFLSLLQVKLAINGFDLSDERKSNRGKGDSLNLSHYSKCAFTCWWLSLEGVIKVRNNQGGNTISI